MKIIRRVLWVISMVSSVLAMLILAFGLYVAQSAPQEASVAAIALAVAIIPYCFARAMDSIK